jgi:glycosyltransferase involved in cell wall biosynthesis
VTVGHINSNRRIPSVLRILAEDDGLRGSIKYVVVGAREPECDREIHNCLRRYGLEACVQLTGQVSDDVLVSYLQHADLCVNLRWPAFESGSASLAEQMLCGKPVIVTDTGIYSELPDDCVWKISPERELEELGIAIRTLANDSQARGTLGKRAREFASQHFLPKQYAVELLRFAWEVRNVRPLLELSDRLGDMLQSMGITSQMPIVSDISRTCGELFGEANEGCN